MHVNLAFLGTGLAFVGWGIDGVVPTLTISGVLKVAGGVILIVAAFIGA